MSVLRVKFMNLDVFFVVVLNFVFWCLYMSVLVVWFLFLLLFFGFYKVYLFLFGWVWVGIMVMCLCNLGLVKDWFGWLYLKGEVRFLFMELLMGNVVWFLLVVVNFVKMFYFVFFFSL